MSRTCQSTSCFHSSRSGKLGSSKTAAVVHNKVISGFQARPPSGQGAGGEARNITLVSSIWTKFGTENCGYPGFSAILLARDAIDREWGLRPAVEYSLSVI
ncbi:hypothetical protein PoB_007154000 [Plakobranchus ocellatus]|uniref:Uncharacterized protein n=1 Tax=Plakobranchus ocellatus TaxID=259542 RepID=A0AAV4DMA3_9GAST|nr:hypothetical protein PoB_007154000 [Plakobranchus ocellatus]